MEPREIPNFLQLGENTFLLDNLSDDARRLYMLIRQSLTTMDELLQEESVEGRNLLGLHKSSLLCADLLLAKNDGWFGNAASSSQQVALNVLEHFRKCVSSPYSYIVHSRI